MAVIPNYYFQSPSIEAASRNLASALAPPDPEKTLMAQRAKWMFAREQQMAQIQDRDRAEHDAGIGALADLFANANAGPIPATSPGEAAYQSQNPQAVPQVMDDAHFQSNVNTALQGNIPYTDVVSASGKRGSPYGASLATLDDKQLAAVGLAKIRSGTQFGVAGMNNEASWARAVLGDDRYRDLALQLAQSNRERDAFKAQADKEHDDRMNTAKLPPKISPTEGRDMRYGVEDWAANLAGKNLAGKDYQLPGDVLNAVVNYENDIYRQNNDAPNAQDEALKFFFGENPQATAADDTSMWNPFTRDTEASIPLRDGKTLAQLQQEILDIKARAIAAGPTTPGQPPPLISSSQGQAAPVPVTSPAEVRLLLPGTRFVIVTGPDAGRTGTR